MKSQKIIKYICTWLKNYSNKSNTSGYVVGISGGIDSAVTSILCAKTGKNVCCLLMPIYQNKTEHNRSIAHGEWLKDNFSNVSITCIDLTKIFDLFASQLPKNIINPLILANTRARIRMTNLYAFAGSNNMLVAGTGNKIEDFGVGFYTKYGDGAVDVSPIADLSKTEVFKIAKELKVIDQIQKAKPTDGLWEDCRSDEEQLGASYEELEWAMEQYQISTKNKFKLRQKEVFDIYSKLHKNNLHKMSPIPVCKIPIDLKN